jgi:glycine cleavage system H protein
MEFPKELKYTEDHEWVRVEGSNATVGITEFAQKELGDIVFVDLPAPGKTVKAHDTLCVVESTKAASDVYSPISGKVKESNAALSKNPEKVNSAPYTDGWITKLESIDQGEINKLMGADQYKTFLAGKI